MKGQTRDPNRLRAQYLENYLLELETSNLVCGFELGMLKTRTNNYPESGRGLGHVAPTISIDFVGVPRPAPNIGRFPHTALEKLVNK